MPLTPTHSETEPGIAYEASGRLTGAELIEAQTKANEHWPEQILYTFFDFNGVMEVDLSTAELRSSADISIEAHKRGSIGRVVAIYAKKDFPYALARMWQVFVEQSGWETAVFRERSEAIAWVRARMAAKFGVEVTLK